VFTALCHGADVGRLQGLANRDELWWFLLAVTKQKIVDHVRSETAQKRGGGRAQTSGGDRGPADESDVVRRFRELVSHEPTPDFLVMLEEEHRRLLDLLRDDQLRSIAAWRVEGYSVEEIAARLRIAPRSVTRKLALIRKTWANEVG
jgi:DNA-directed RNA polymerase specialized sigma24 family protein